MSADFFLTDDFSSVRVRETSCCFDYPDYKMCTLHYRESIYIETRRITRKNAVLIPFLGIPEKKADLQAALVAPSGLKCNYNLVDDDDDVPYEINSL